MLWRVEVAAQGKKLGPLIIMRTLLAWRCSAPAGQDRTSMGRPCCGANQAARHIKLNSTPRNLPLEDSCTVLCNVDGPQDTQPLPPTNHSTTPRSGYIASRAVLL